MSDYISREAAVAFAEHAYREWNLAMAAADGQRQINRCFNRQELCKAVASVFEDAPAADVEPVRHGRWINQRGCAVCDQCGTSPAFWSLPIKTVNDYPDYCYGCGAKMELG